jgi:hypothetical protein
MAGLAVRYKNRIPHIMTKYFSLLMKLPGDAVGTGFAVGAFILFLRKVIYYVPVVGIIQTKSSICWVHGRVMLFLFLFLVGFVILLIFSKVINELKDILAFLVTSLFIFTVVLSALLLYDLPADFGKKPPDPQTWATLILSPLLMLKMLCSGEYPGLLTSFVVGYFIIGNYEKFNPRELRSNKKFASVLGLIIIVFGAFCITIFPGDWEKRFAGKVQAAKSEEKVMGLLEAANSILDENHKEIALKEIAVAAAKIGDIEWAMSITKKINNTKIKNAAIAKIQQILGKIERKND